jgi:hypothetical protein
MSTTTPIQPEYRLADHVRACHVDGQVILLDLQRDKYIGVGGPLTSALSMRISGWPVSTPDSSQPNGDEMERWVGNLRNQAMLVSASTPAPAYESLASPHDSLSHCEHAHAPGVSWRRFLALAHAAVLTSHWLKRHRMATIARKLSALRPVYAWAGEVGQRRELRHASAWYQRMRPLVITSHDKCLHDSLTLLRFLAAEKLYPSWVVGVRTRPFAAHSWVQSGDLVLNDTHEYVRGFTPILVV